MEFDEGHKMWLKVVENFQHVAKILLPGNEGDECFVLVFIMTEKIFLFFVFYLSRVWF